ncbi:hypothetical protein K435DRAFT_690140, partial [Dendrothele bispora CBS 962.96]
MSSSSTLPNKRKRINTSGDDDSTPSNPSNSNSEPRATSNAIPNIALPRSWIQELESLPRNAAQPPPTVIKVFLEKYNQGLKDFDSAQNTLQRVLVAQRKFEASASEGNHPSWIANHLKGPSFQFPKTVLDEAHESLEDARKVYDEALVVATSKATDYIRACHDATARLCKEKVNIDKCVQNFLEDLTVYTTEIIEATGRGNNDKWNAYAKSVAAAFGQDLENLYFEFTAASARSNQEREAKAATVTAARHDAEMVESTKPIGKIIDE